MRRFPGNRPVADFLCGACAEEFELKSQKGRFGRRVVDGAFSTMCARLAADNNPSLILMNYDLGRLAVTDLFFVPRHFFVREVIEERPPLAPTARRAGWVGCNIRLDAIPESGKVFFGRSAVCGDRAPYSPHIVRRLVGELNSLILCVKANGSYFSVRNAAEKFPFGNISQESH